MSDSDNDYDPHEETGNGKARESDHTPNSSKITFRTGEGAPMSGRFNLAREKKFARDYYERHKNQ